MRQRRGKLRGRGKIRTSLSPGGLLSKFRGWVTARVGKHGKWALERKAKRKAKQAEKARRLNRRKGKQKR